MMNDGLARSPHPNAAIDNACCEVGPMPFSPLFSGGVNSSLSYRRLFSRRRDKETVSYRHIRERVDIPPSRRARNLNSLLNLEHSCAPFMVAVSYASARVIARSMTGKTGYVGTSRFPLRARAGPIREQAVTGRHTRHCRRSMNLATLLRRSIVRGAGWCIGRDLVRFFEGRK